MGMIISEITGSVGGHTFSNSVGGMTMRTKSNPSKRNSNRADFLRVNQSYVLQQWSLLTDAQRAVWNQYAQFLNKKLKHNPNRILNGQGVWIWYQCKHWPIVDTLFDPPVFTIPDIAALTISLEISAPGVFDVVLSRTLLASEYLVLFLSGVKKTSRAKAPGGLKGMDFLNNTAGPVDIAARYIVRYGAIPATGDYVDARYEIMTTDTAFISPSTFTQLEVQ